MSDAAKACGFDWEQSPSKLFGRKDEFRTVSDWLIARWRDPEFGPDVVVGDLIDCFPELNWDVIEAHVRQRAEAEAVSSDAPSPSREVQADMGPPAIVLATEEEGEVLPDQATLPLPSSRLPEKDPNLVKENTPAGSSPPSLSRRPSPKDPVMVSKDILMARALIPDLVLEITKNPGVFRRYLRMHPKLVMKILEYYTRNRR